MADEAIFERINTIKKQLGPKLMILGHHYQRDTVIQFADERGDSFELSKKAANNRLAEYIVFCGVHFMAESADILTAPHQTVILPHLEAGCFMAEMADIDSVSAAWANLQQIRGQRGKIIPITYMNSEANLKAFCGEHGGAVCTSANAAKILRWAFTQGDTVFFFPDEHLGRNTAYGLGVALDEMAVWEALKVHGGNSPEKIQRAKVILWQGFCNVHQFFTPEYIEIYRRMHPGIKILVHPECPFEVVQKSDYNGSTGYIIKTIEAAAPGSKWAIGTEMSLVNRLQHEHPDKFILSLAPFTANCSTMIRTSPAYLLWALENIVAGTIQNQIRVPEDVAAKAIIALERMLSI
jgi:quinolinate synthase